MSTTNVISAPNTVTVRVQLAAAVNWSHAKRAPGLIVIHSTEGREGDGATDANVAAGVAVAKPAGRRTSFHYVVDADSVTQCVPDINIAWHAGHTANLIGIGVELCGTAKQTRAEWLDATSVRTLGNAARLIADLCARHKIPPVYAGAVALQTTNPRGITTHADVSVAWRESSHWDPGPNFPIAEFIDAIQCAMPGVV